MKNYILDQNNNPVVCDDIVEWGRWFEKANRQVARDKVGPYTVSTIFMGIDHNFFGYGPPLLWESMIFNDELMDGKQDELDQTQERYTSVDDALVGHTYMIAKCVQLQRTRGVESIPTPIGR